MADITLSKYCDQAKELIRTDSYNQAIAICRHILKHYPRHVRAYRLLGEACLEKGDYVEAANFFKRVLGADMEDMVVYVGLGIIFDEQGALDEAIWQLERAFELSPGNAEIRQELQRLYGERDGTPPPKLRLTPAALGRLYLREELYQRAIDEFRDVLNEDRERADIQVALAQALWWTGQKQEAADVCQALLEQYPNCLKANLILGEILLSGNREEEGQALLETAQALDPENSVAELLFRDKSPLPVEAVSVPRLDDKHLEQEVQELAAEMPSSPGRSEPADELLSYRSPEASEEAMPDWLRRLQEEERESAEGHAPSAPGAQGMPDWLQQLAEERAGEAVEDAEPGDLTLESEQTGPAEGPEMTLPGEPISLEATASPGEEGEQGVAPSEEPPDWLSQLKAEGPAEEESAALARDTEGEPPDWLANLQAAPTEEKSAPETEGEVPSWLLDLRREAADLEGGTDEGMVRDWGARPVDEEPEESLEAKPGAMDEEPEPAGDEAAERPRATEETEISPETMKRLRETMPDESDSIEDIMDWMEKSKALLGDEGVPESEMEQRVEDVIRSPEEEEIPTWLRDLRPETPAREEPIKRDETEAQAEEKAVPTPEEEIPTWLRDLRPTAEEEGAASAEEGWEAVASDETPGMEEAMVSEEEFAATLEVTPGPLPESEEPFEETPAPQIEEDVPSWLRRIREEAAEQATPFPSEEAEETPRERAPTEAAPEAAEDEVPTWLRELRAEEGVEQAGGPQEQEAGAEDLGMPAPQEEEMPSWLRQLRTEVTHEETAPPVETPEPATGEAQPTAPEEEEMPSWLRELRAEASTTVPTLSAEGPEIPGEEPPPHVVEAELPSWLQELKAEVAGEAPTTAPEAIEPHVEEEAPTPMGPEEMPTWLRELRAEAEVSEEFTPQGPESPAEGVPAGAPEEAEVPSWLRELRAQAEEGQTDILRETAAAAAGEVPLPPLEAEELPSWLRELRAEAAPRAPSAEFGEDEGTIEELAAEGAPAWPKEESEPLPEAYEPAEEAVRVEEPAPPEIAREAEEAGAAPRRDRPPAPGAAPDDYHQYLEANPRDHTARLSLARAYSRQGDLDRAAEQYEVLLSYGSMVEEVKDDLKAAAESAPDHLPTHELLADAYMRSGDLQKALEKYRWLRLTLTR
jgi:tetratricopeptide (TPR) repeat protein